MSDSESGQPADVAPPPVVFKFGGTSVGTVSRFRTVVDLIEKSVADGRPVAVVSAQGKVTRRLSQGMEAFATDTNDREAVVDELLIDLQDGHWSQAKEVLSDDGLTRYEEILEDRLHELRAVFSTVAEEGFNPAARDAVLATGEQLSVPMVTLALRDAGLTAPFCDATNLVVTDETYGEANVLIEKTTHRVRRWYRSLDPDAIPVVAGFLGGTIGGTTTTLGFEGSDYSAALFAEILDAGCVTRYTNVDGLYSDDPREHEDAQRFDRLSMDEAYALTESGRLGMHPKTLRPLVEANIPMQVRSIDEPEGHGTEIIPDGLENVRFVPPIGSRAIRNSS